MGNPAVDAAAVNAAGQIASQSISALAQSSINKKTRKYNLEQYAKERADALVDWHRQNDYNSPAAQMARFKAAGLNPHLIYGQTNTADPVRSTNTAPWNPRAPEFNFDAGAVMGQYYDTQQQVVATDNLKKQGNVLIQEAALKASQNAATVMQTAKTEQELTQARNLAGISLQAAEQDLRNKTQQYDLNLQANERAIAQNSQSLSEGAERILKLRAETLKTQTDTHSSRLQQKQIEAMTEDIRKSKELKELDINLKRLGINPNDPMWQRVLGQFLEGMKPAEIKKNLENWWQAREKEKGSTWSNPNR